MKEIILKKGVTLIELIIAVSLISIVLLGIYAVSSVLGNNNQDYGQKYLVKSETQATLDNILQNASMAIGSKATDGTGKLIDQGVLLGNDPVSGWGDPNSFCIHQNPTGGADIWQCYTYYPAGASANQIFSCTMPLVGVVNPRGAASCNGVARCTIRRYGK